MPGNALFYIALSIGLAVFILFIQFIWFLKTAPAVKYTLMYYKVDLPGKKITTIPFSDLEKEAKLLIDNDYELIAFHDAKAFTDKEKLPRHSLLIVSGEAYNISIKEIFPFFLKEQISIFIFLPVIVPADNKARTKQVQDFSQSLFNDR
jgi:hypothetical protein